MLWVFADSSADGWLEAAAAPPGASLQEMGVGEGPEHTWELKQVCVCLGGGTSVGVRGKVSRVRRALCMPKTLPDTARCQKKPRG